MAKNKLSQLKEQLCVQLSQLLSVKVEPKHIRLATEFGDATISVAKAYGLNAESVISAIQRADIRFNGIPVIETARESSGFINIRLSARLLEYLCDSVIADFDWELQPFAIEGDYEYSVARLHMLKNKSDDFYRFIEDKWWRKAFLVGYTLLENSGPAAKQRAAAYALTAQRSMVNYDGVGKIAQAILLLISIDKGVEK